MHTMDNTFTPLGKLISIASTAQETHDTGLRFWKSSADGMQSLDARFFPATTDQEAFLIAGPKDGEFALIGIPVHTDHAHPSSALMPPLLDEELEVAPAAVGQMRSGGIIALSDEIHELPSDVTASYIADKVKELFRGPRPVAGLAFAARMKLAVGRMTNVAQRHLRKSISTYSQTRKLEVFAKTTGKSDTALVAAVSIPRLRANRLHWDMDVFLRRYGARQASQLAAMQAAEAGANAADAGGQSAAAPFADAPGLQLIVECRSFPSEIVLKGDQSAAIRAALDHAPWRPPQPFEMRVVQRGDEVVVQLMAWLGPASGDASQMARGMGPVLDSLTLRNIGHLSRGVDSILEAVQGSITA